VAITYRSDTGTLRADNVTGAQTVSFVTTQPSAGDLVVAGGVFYPSASSTLVVTDNQGNGTYANDAMRDHAAGTSFPTTASYVCLSSFDGVAASGTFTMSFNTQTANSYYLCGAIAFSQAETSSALDVSTGATIVDPGVGQTSISTGSTATTAQADAVAVSVYGYSGGTNLAPLAATGFTITASSTDTAGGVGALGYKILSAIGTQSATWTFALSGSADDHATVIAVYKGGTAAPGLPSYKINQRELMELIAEMSETRPNRTELYDVRAWF